MIQLITTLFVTLAAAISPRAVVPLPVSVTEMEGTCTLQQNPTLKVVCKSDCEGVDALKDYAKDELGWTLSEKGDIVITLGDRNFVKKVNADASIREDCRDAAYSLTIGKKGIDIKALAPKGAFYALQTLRQMTASGDELQCCAVYDWPRFPYRGLMIDVSRNFRDRQFIEKQIDAMALLKMDKLHLHLMDDAGWRIQIDSRPMLTKKAAWRIGGTWKQWRELGCFYSEEGSPMASGGYYTKDDVRELVAYAAERHIDIVPEFEIPGHSREVLEAYPELACVDENGERVMNSDMCPGSEYLFDFIEDVMAELVELFPSEYIHIGGDEASRTAWKKCPHCQKIMAENGLADVAQLQSWVTRKVEKIVESHGRKMVGWDEIMEGGLSDNAVVMSWRGSSHGENAIGQGHDVIMSPNTWYYLDYTQDAPIYQPEAIGGYISLAKAYSYDADIDSPHLLGVQGNAWTEYIPTAEHLEYMLYPRALAVAETGWSRKEDKNYENFKERASRFCAELKRMGYNPFDIDKEFGTRMESREPLQHLAVGKPVQILTPYAEKYRASGDVSVNDGLRGGWSYGDDRWLGFIRDMDIIIDLEEKQPLHYVGATFMAQRNNHVAVPERVEVYVSDDGENYTLASVSYSQLPADTSDMCYETLSCVVNVSARYVRFKAFRRNLPLHAWLFTDEIVVN